MMEYAVKPPTIPIPFHKLLKVVALVDAENRAGRRTARSARGREVRGRDQRSTTTATCSRTPPSAHTSSPIDGDRLEPARKLVRAVRGAGFSTPLWALADSRRLSQALAPE